MSYGSYGPQCLETSTEAPALRYSSPVKRVGWSWVGSILLVGPTACRPTSAAVGPTPAVSTEPAVPAKSLPAPSVAPQPDTAALDEACAKIGKDSKALLVEAQAEFEAKLRGRETVDSEAFLGLGECQRGPGGAWVLAVLDMGVHIDDTPDGVFWQFEGAVQLTFIADDGGALAREDAVVLSIANSVELSDEVRLRLLAVHDYDGDGVVEAVTDQHSWGYDLNEHEYDIWTRTELDDESFVAPWEFREPGFQVDVVTDLDGDGVLDVLDEHRWRAGECFGMSGSPDLGNPPIAFHARDDGSFSSDDEVAAEFLRTQCPQLPDQLLVGGDVEWELRAKHTIACARAWGRSADEVVAQIRQEWDGLEPGHVKGDRSCGAPRSEFEAFARIEPPLQLG